MLNNIPKVPKPQFVLLDADEPLLGKVTPRLVEPLRLAHAGNGYDAIAEQLQIPVGTVKSRIFRAREHTLKLRAGRQVSS